jgi:hypothetical protein
MMIRDRLWDLTRLSSSVNDSESTMAAGPKGWSGDWERVLSGGDVLPSHSAMFCILFWMSITNHSFHTE